MKILLKPVIQEIYIFKISIMRVGIESETVYLLFEQLAVIESLHFIGRIQFFFLNIDFLCFNKRI